MDHGLEYKDGKIVDKDGKEIDVDAMLDDIDAAPSDEMPQSKGSQTSGRDAASLSAPGTGPFHPAIGEAYLRKIIRNILNEDTHAYAGDKIKRLVKLTVNAAEKYADTVKRSSMTGSPLRDKAAIEQLESLSAEAQSFITWAQKNRVKWLREAQLFVRLLEQFTKNTGFWKVPKFANVEKYAAETQEAYEALRRSAAALFHATK
jgi:hypothetical protein